MTEREMEDLVWTHSEHFLEAGLTPFRRQHSTDIGRSDLIFKDRLEHLLAVELKHGVLPRGAAYQLYDYFGALKSEFPDQPVELLVLANEIPRERRLACERHHIECREISESKFRRIAIEVGYLFASELTPLDPTQIEYHIVRKSEIPNITADRLLAFRLGTQQYFLLACLLEGKRNREQLWQAFAEQFVPDGAPSELRRKKTSFNVILGDIQRPMGLYSGSRSLPLRVSSTGIYSVDSESLSLVEKAVTQGVLQQLKQFSFKTDIAKIRTIFQRFSLPCTDKVFAESP